LFPGWITLNPEKRIINTKIPSIHLVTNLRRFICGKEKELKDSPIVLKKLEPERLRASITFSQDFCDVFLRRLVVIAIIPTNTKNIDPLASPSRIRSPQMIKESFEENCIRNI
jgi:hypothetical protein